MPFQRFQFKAMGSPCEILLSGQKTSSMEQAYLVAKEEIARLETKYTRFQTTSLTSKINNAAGKHQVDIDTETSKLLNYADTVYTQSDGLFDITSGVLRKAWGFKSGRVPTDSELAPLLELVGWTSIERTDQSVYLPKVGMQIDFGGFVKEYAADVAASKCIDSGIQSGLVNLGGDIRVIGPHPNGEGWRTGIQHPRKLDKTIAKLNIYEGGIATSGDYERYMLVDGRRYCHILNPKTGMSSQLKHASMSVIADSCLVAGSCATIAMLKSDTEPNWLDELQLPYLSVDQTMTLKGPLS